MISSLGIGNSLSRLSGIIGKYLSTMPNGTCRHHARFNQMLYCGVMDRNLDFEVEARNLRSQLTTGEVQQGHQNVKHLHNVCTGTGSRIRPLLFLNNCDWKPQGFSYGYIAILQRHFLGILYSSLHPTKSDPSLCGRAIKKLLLWLLFTLNILHFGIFSISILSIRLC